MKIGIIGNGNIGSAMAKLFNRNGFVNFNISDIDKRKSFRNNENNIETSDILFLCVDDKNISTVVEEIKTPKTVVSTSSLPVSAYPSHLKVIRIMPSISVAYGKGVIPYYSKDNIPTIIQQYCKGPTLFKCNREELLDVTSLYNASMPAISAYLAREQIRLAIESGLSPSEAYQIHLSSLDAFSSLIKEQSLEQIIFQGKGTTILNSLDREGFQLLLRKSFKF